MRMIMEQVKELREIADIHNIKVDLSYEQRMVVKQAADTIESLSEKLSAANMERAERYYNGGWIACKDRLPEDGADVLVWFEYFRYGGYNRLFQTIGISYMYEGKWSEFVNGESGWNQLSIIAWQPLPKPYKK